MEVLTLTDASRESEKKNKGGKQFWKEKGAVFFGLFKV